MFVTESRKNFAIHTFAGIILSAYIFYCIGRGQDSHLLIHDGLDSLYVWYKVLAESGLILSPANTVVPIIGDLPRVAFGTGINVIPLLFSAFSPLTAYTINFIAIHVVAYASAYLLFSRHVCPSDRISAALAALCFSLLPFWPYAGLSIAGMPLVFYAFLNIQKYGLKYKDAVLLAVMPLYSSFLIAMMFAIALLTIMGTLQAIKIKRINKTFFLTIALFSAYYLAIDYQLVWFVLNPLYESNRTDFVAESLNLRQAIRLTIDNFLYSQYHAQALNKPVILCSIAIAFAAFVFKQRKLPPVPILYILGTISLTAVVYGFWDWGPTNELKEKVSLLNIVQFNRFHFLQPALWASAFCFSLSFIKKHAPCGIIIIALLGLMQIVCSFNYVAEEKAKENNITYRQFFAENQFTKVANYIQEPMGSYKVISIGLHPSIAQYNGFHTADFYAVNYPKAYKAHFRKVIEPELQKNEAIKSYFDNWGNRAYAFSDEAGLDFLPQRKGKTIHRYRINKTAAKSLNIQYALSGYKIENSNMELLETFEDADSAWTIYLYKI